MQIDSSVLPYIKGEKFSNQLSFTIAKKEKVVDRIEYLCRYAKGKKILHIGCVDHEPLIREKISNNTWLHKRLDEVAEMQFGIDINKQGLEFVKNELGYQNVAYENVLEGEIHPTISATTWDAVIMGEILEHVENPVFFLTKIRERYGKIARELVITVPNVMSIKNAALSFVNKEQINSDHFYWFSPYTLSRILTKAGFTPLYHDFATYYSLNNKTNRLKKFVLKLLLSRNPAFRPSLIYVAKF